MRRSPLHHAGAALALAAALAACGAEDPAPASPRAAGTVVTQPPDPAATAPEVPAVPAVLEFTAETVDGGTFDGASLAGQDALLWFWAPRCPVCQREAPLVASLAREYAGRVAVVGVGGLSGDLDAMREFVDRGGVGAIPHLADTAGSLYARFGVTQQYDVGVLDESGEVRIVTGPLSEDELRAELDALAAG